MAGIAVVDVLVVAGSAHRYGYSGLPAVVAALLLAPLAVTAAARAGRRVGGPGFSLAVAGVYTLLPLIGAAYMLSSYRTTFLHQALPNLLGFRATGWFVLGIAVALAYAYLPETLLAVAGTALAAVAIAEYGVRDLAGVRIGLHETAWSIAFAEWLVVAGVLGVAGRSWRLGTALAGLLVAGVVRAAHTGYADASFWQSLGVTMPAIALLISGTTLLLPRLWPAAASSRQAR